MIDLILTHGYFLCDDEKEKQIMKPYAPLGLMYISSYLKQNGFKVELIDSTFLDIGILKKYLSENPGGILGIYTNLITRHNIIRIIQFAKQNNFSVVLGGPESANYPENYLNNGADIVVIGEGEQALSELIPAIREKGVNRLSSISGIVFKDESGKVIKTQPRQATRDISSYPWPDREAVDVNRYLNVWREHHGAGSISMITARGCPYRCTWCSHAVFGYSHRRRKPAECADELEYIIGKFDPDKIWYADDVFTISHPWLFDYEKELKKRNIKIPFETISRADRLMNPAALDTLAEMGCERIWIGSESGSQRILDAMKRDVTVEQVQWATREVKERGIKVGMFLMWGYGDETLDDIEMTVEHVKLSNPDVFFTTVAYPIKNTPFFDEYADSISMTGDWDSSTDRDYKLSTQRDPEYYKAADKLLFNSVEAYRVNNTMNDDFKNYTQCADEARQFLINYERKHAINKTGI